LTELSNEGKKDYLKAPEMDLMMEPPRETQMEHLKGEYLVVMTEVLFLLSALKS